MPPNSHADVAFVSFSKNSGVLSVGVLVIRAPLIGVHISAPDFWKLSCLWNRKPFERVGGTRIGVGLRTVAWSSILR